MTTPLETSEFSGTIVHDEIVPARAPWLHHLAAGETLHIVDLEGNQAVDFLLYSAADDAERYSAQDTVAAQGNLFLRAGTVLRSNEGRAMMTILATSVEYHDTIGGACSCESNTLRYGHHTKSQHACVENFLEANLIEGRGKRDIVFNINFFMNVPVEETGRWGCRWYFGARPDCRSAREKEPCRGPGQMPANPTILGNGFQSPSRGEKNPLPPWAVLKPVFFFAHPAGRR